MAVNDSERKKRWRADKLKQLGSSIFAEVSGWKAEARRKGSDVIDLSIGSPDLGPTEAIRRSLAESVLRPDRYAYPGASGSLAFRQAAADWMQHRFGVVLDPREELVSLMGSQDGLSHLAQAICNPGDLAIVPNPGYPIYTGALAIAGVRSWLLPLREENGFLPDLAAIPEEVWQEATFLLLNIPGNPASARADLGFFEQLLAYAKRYGVLIVHDLAYSEMGFDGYRPISILQAEGALEQAVEFHSFSKSFNMAGCRIGFLAGNRVAVAALRELKENIDFGVFHPIQEAAITALRHAIRADEGASSSAQAGAGGVAGLYEQRRDAFVEALAREGWAVPKPAATMFVWTRLPEGFREQSSREFARGLLAETGVAVIPGDAFGSEGEGYVRIALVEEEERLLEAAKRMGRYLHLRGREASASE
ncbi:aminotransferase class I/II-fold pyridoxal phosphate-dependent enzyme [Gorillibacterium sp. CAU 1737]|uniref:aminotransferase class I/II-fold pyridoxal phosphate-dependent enzyme n=1 Tax=Gorillibacterium sp. CAU 1737 TaxID=3140362 RepID=UPI0032616F04